MTDHDDGEDEPRLPHALRAVWLAMPDEEPPERGLAELMAAARIKAEAMAKPSLWQRIVALLRRPPVLALASIMVLIGGAVLIGQRKDSMQAEPTVERVGGESTTAPVTAAPEAPAGAAQPPVAGSAHEEDEPPPADQAVVAEPEAKPDPTPAPPKHRPPARVTTKTDANKYKAEADALKKAELAETKQLEQRSGRGASADSKVAAPDKLATEGFVESDHLRDTEIATTAAPVEAPSKTPPVKPGSTTTQASRATQHLQQAKSAAARGDCEAARVLMKRAAKEDVAASRKALASDAALRKCVE